MNMSEPLLFLFTALYIALNVILLHDTVHLTDYFNFFHFLAPDLAEVRHAVLTTYIIAKKSRGSHRDKA